MEKKNQLMCAKDAKQSDLLIKKKRKGRTEFYQSDLWFSYFE